MHPQFRQLMSQATRLTRSGDLAAAMAAIQQALCNGRANNLHPTEDADVIEVEAWEVPGDAGESEPARPTREEDLRPAARPAVRGDTFAAGSFRNSSGRRDYKLYSPPDHHAGPRPLVVMLHGCTQDADDFAAGTAMNEAARRLGFYVLYPVQSRDTNPQKCWNWFKPNHQRRGRGEPSILAQMALEVIETHAVDASRVYVAGLSAGGAMAAILAEAYPDIFAAAGVHSGLAVGTATDLPSALSAMKGGQPNPGSPAGSGVPTIVFHGDRDTTVHCRNAAHVIACSAGQDAQEETKRVPGGRGEHPATQRVYRNAAGAIVAEQWIVHGGGHAWSGGSPRGSYTDVAGPDATAEMLRFFLERKLG